MVLTRPQTTFGNQRFRLIFSFRGTRGGTLLARDPLFTASTSSTIPAPPRAFASINSPSIFAI